MNITQTPKVIVTESPFCVTVQGPFGGGYRRLSSKDSIVKDAASGLAYNLYGQREVKYIGPQWVKDELAKQGFVL